ncbi:MAG: NYN domain-containing protein [Candidatus Nanoarchaeia archaeon]|nr:NYN domain-containing protein [Candidatus Nanoarchaeia archaeon]MDD5741239.1 NYN domain-containing protein [Candidatus Nanoarchaeia archaeon]
MKRRISVYIDGANFIYGLKSIHPKYSDYHFDFERFIKRIIGKDDLIDIIYYNSSLKQNINQRRFQEQQKLLARLRKIPKCKIILCKRQKRFNKNNEEYYTIKGDDIHLALDMLNDSWENRYDKAVLISGDGDFIPLVKHVRTKNKEVEIISFEKIVSRGLIDEANSFILINKKIVNKFFWRGSYKKS